MKREKLKKGELAAIIATRKRWTIAELTSAAQTTIGSAGHALLNERKKGRLICIARGIYERPPVPAAEDLPLPSPARKQDAVMVKNAINNANRALARMARGPAPAKSPAARIVARMVKELRALGICSAEIWMTETETTLNCQTKEKIA